MEFVEACKNSNFELIKELFEKGVDIHYNDEQGFVYLCDNGELEMAKWLYEHGKIDIHSNHEWALRNACWFGRLEVAKWLVSIGAKFNDNVILYACSYKQMAIIKWFYSIGKNVEYYIQYFYRCNANERHQNILYYHLAMVLKNTIILKKNEIFKENICESKQDNMYESYLLNEFRYTILVKCYKKYLKEKENYEYFYIFFLHSLINNPLLEVNLITTIKEFLFY